MKRENEGLFYIDVTRLLMCDLPLSYEYFIRAKHISYIIFRGQILYTARHNMFLLDTLFLLLTHLFYMCF